MGNFIKLSEVEKLSYRDMKSAVVNFNDEFRGKSKPLSCGVVVTEGSFDKVYPIESRVYLFSSENKAFISGMGGYSIFASSFDGSDDGIRLEAYLSEEHGGIGGWEVEYAFMLPAETDLVMG